MKKGRILDLDSARLTNQSINAAEVDHIAIAAREVESVTISRLSGSLHLGGGGIAPRCDNLVLERCDLDRLVIYDAVLANCVFKDCRVEDLLAAGTIFGGCKFSGSIRRGVFSAPSELGTTDVKFEGNDFSECDLGDVAFRGEIDLHKQRFNAVQTRMNIENAELLLAKIEKRIDQGSQAQGLWDIRTMLKRALTFKQSQVFISKEFARRFLVKYLAKVAPAERKLVSPEFAAWAGELEQHCDTRKSGV